MKLLSWLTSPLLFVSQVRWRSFARFRRSARRAISCLKFGRTQNSLTQYCHDQLHLGISGSQALMLDRAQQPRDTLVRKALNGGPRTTQRPEQEEGVACVLRRVFHGKCALGAALISDSGGETR